MQDETAHFFKRPALMEVNGFDGVYRIDRKLVSQISKGEFFDFFVHNETHCPFFGVRANINQRAGKPLVVHIRHGNKAFPGKI